MCKTDRQFLDKLIAHAAKTRALLSNRMKPERERSVCRAFLRALGVSFREKELIATTDEPADVAFRDARFQVRDLLDDRKRGKDWKESEEKYLSARCIGEVTEPTVSPIPVRFEVLIPEIAAALSEKATKYGKGRANIDALVYVDLKGKFLAANATVTDTEHLESQGWRSVSLLFSPYSAVLFATEGAPSFLRDAQREVRMKWADIDTLFGG